MGWMRTATPSWRAPPSGRARGVKESWGKCSVGTALTCRRSVCCIPPSSDLTEDRAQLRPHSLLSPHRHPLTGVECTLRPPTKALRQLRRATHTNLAKSSGGPYVAVDLRGDGPAVEQRAPCDGHRGRESPNGETLG
eukprot:235595-Prymnesium_polylepis.1